MNFKFECPKCKTMIIFQYDEKINGKAVNYNCPICNNQFRAKTKEFKPKPYKIRPKYINIKKFEKVKELE